MSLARLLVFTVCARYNLKWNEQYGYDITDDARNLLREREQCKLIKPKAWLAESYEAELWNSGPHGQTLSYHLDLINFKSLSVHIVGAKQYFAWMAMSIGRKFWPTMLAPVEIQPGVVGNAEFGFELKPIVVAWRLNLNPTVLLKHQVTFHL